MSDTPSAIAIIGRSNVGKSTLFNRLVGYRRALTGPMLSLTRDGISALIDLDGVSIQLHDTAGWELAPRGSLDERMREKTENIVKQAQLALMVVDARTGLLPIDEMLSRQLRYTGVEILLVANKSEGNYRISDEIYKLGLGPPIAISALHNEGIDKLRMALHDQLSQKADRLDRPAINPINKVDLKLTFAGRPNVGKSSLINSLMGQGHLLVGPETGITRDAVTLAWAWQDRMTSLTDTAGLRRRARILDASEKLASKASWDAIQQADIVILVLDATNSIDHQDLAIAQKIGRAGRALVIAANKWDCICQPEDQLLSIKNRIEDSLYQYRGVEIQPVSALKGYGLRRLMQAAANTAKRWSCLIPTSRLHQWLTDMLLSSPPPAFRGRIPKPRHIVQWRTSPPGILLWVSHPQALPESYHRYLINGLRRDFGLDGIPVQLRIKKKKNPYEGQSTDQKRRSSR